MQLSRVINHTLFEIIIGMKSPTFYRQIANTLPTYHQQSTVSQSTVGQQMSCRKLSFQKNLNKSVGQLSVRCWSTVGQLSANSRPTDHQQSADRLPTVSRQITNSRPTVGEGSCSSQLHDKQSLIKIVNALVFSRLYGSSVWCNTSKKSITKLQNMQNSASCTITNTKKYDQTCNASFEAVGLENNTSDPKVKRCCCGL